MNGGTKGVFCAGALWLCPYCLKVQLSLSGVALGRNNFCATGRDLGPVSIHI